MRNNKTWWWGAVLAALVGLKGAGLSLLAQPGAPPATTVALPTELQAPAGKQRLDPYGDPLPEGALARIGTLRFRHDKMGGFQGSAAFLPDSKTLVSVHGTNTVYFWDVATGKELRRFQVPGLNTITQVGLSPDGNGLAVNGQQEVQLWDLSTEPPQMRWKYKAQGNVFDLAFAPDGKMLACGNAFQEGENQLRKIRLLDAKTGEQRQALDMASPQQARLAFSPNGKLLVEWQGGEASSVYVWDLVTGKHQHTLSGFFGGFAPDSQTLATRDEKGLVLWDVATAKEKKRIARTTPLGSPLLLQFELAVFLPDGTLLEADRVRARFLDPTTGKQRRPEIDASSLAFSVNNAVPLLSPNGKLLTSVGNNVIRLWNVDTGKVVGPEGIPGGVQEIAFSRKGDTLATLSSLVSGGSFLTGEANVQLWQTNTGMQGPRLKFKPQVQAPHVTASLGQLSYAHDHRLYTQQLTVADGLKFQSDLAGWDARTGKVVDVPPDILQVGENALFGVQAWAVSPDGRLLARKQDGHIALFDLATGKQVRRLDGEAPAQMTRLVFSADGLSLAADGSQDNIRAFAVWDVTTGRLRLSPDQISASAQFQPFALSSDGRWLAASQIEQMGNPGRAMQLYEVASGRAGPRLSLDKEQIAPVAFSPDGRTLAAGCQDGTILLWQLSTGQKRRSLKGHRGGVTSLAFSADGSRLASGSQDTTVLIWDLRSVPQAKPAADTKRPKTEELLDALARPDAAAAYHAMCQLAEGPATGLAELRKRLEPIPLPNPKQVERWIAELDSKKFKTRQQAFAELGKQGDSVEVYLRKALEERPALEKRQRIEQLLERLHPSRNPARLFVLRGVEVLERMDTPEARKVLEELAQLSQGYLVAREAKVAVQRLSQRSSAATP